MLGMELLANLQGTQVSFMFYKVHCSTSLKRCMFRISTIIGNEVLPSFSDGEGTLSLDDKWTSDGLNPVELSLDFNSTRSLVIAVRKILRRDVSLQEAQTCFEKLLIYIHQDEEVQQSLQRLASKAMKEGALDGQSFAIYPDLPASRIRNPLMIATLDQQGCRAECPGGVNE